MNELPHYIEENSDGTLKVKTREGEFVMEETSGEIIARIERWAKRDPNATEYMKSIKILAGSIIEPKTTDTELLKKKSSTLNRLSTAINLFSEEGDSFLQDTRQSSGTSHLNE